MGLTPYLLEELVELLPCPFCGGPGRVFKNGAGWFTVMCDDDNDCEFTPHASAKSEAEVIGIWNRRPAIVSALSDRDRVRACLSDALDKIEAYHAHMKGEYVGGVPNQVLLPRMRSLIAPPTEKEK